MNPQGQQVGNYTYERKDADAINIGLIIGILALVMIVCFLGSWGILHFLNRQRRAAQPSRPALTDQSAMFPEPRLESEPGLSRIDSQLNQSLELNSYGWVDRSKGVARIPIKRAMELLVQRGLPSVGAGRTRLQLMQSRPETDVQPQHPAGSPSGGTTP